MTAFSTIPCFGDCGRRLTFRALQRDKFCGICRAKVNNDCRPRKRLCFPLGCAIICYESGLPTTALNRLLGYDSSHISKRLRLAGVKIRPAGGARYGPRSRKQPLQNAPEI